jgi:hypothetical protein
MAAALPCPPCLRHIPVLTRTLGFLISGEFSMRIGDLSRARASVEPRGRAPFLALSLTLATSILIAGWLALPSSDQRAAETNVAAASGQDPAAGRMQPDENPQPAPAPSAAAPPLQVADAGSGVTYGGSPPAAMPVETDVARETVQGTLVADPIVPPVQAVGAPAPAPEIAEPMEVASVTGATTERSLAANPQELAGLVDLNTASVEDLNALRGAGRIGRAIVRGRPYASVEDLVKKRVLSRSVYVRVKDQVTAH